MLLNKRKRNPGLLSYTHIFVEYPCRVCTGSLPWKYVPSSPLRPDLLLDLLSKFKPTSCSKWQKYYKNRKEQKSIELYKYDNYRKELMYGSQAVSFTKLEPSE